MMWEMDALHMCTPSSKVSKKGSVGSLKKSAAVTTIKVTDFLMI